MPIVRTEVANDNGRSEDRDRLIESLVGAAQPLLNGSLPFDELERELLRVSNEFVRRALERTLQTMSELFTDTLLISLPSEKSRSKAKARYRRHQLGRVRYHSLCGPLDIERWTYRLVGTRNGPTVVPIELQAGLISRATPALGYAVARGHAKSPIRHVEDDLRAAHRQPPSRATMDRLARAIGLEIHGLVPLLEPVVRAEEELPSGAHAINVGLDRTSVPMEEAALEPRQSGSFTPKITVRYRMAYVGTVCVTNRAGEVLRAWRYAAPAHEDAEGILSRMISDINRALEQKPRMKIGVVQDGAPEMWNLVREALSNNGPTKNRAWRETVDRYHLMERIADVLEHFYPAIKDEPQRKKMLDEWRREINQCDDAPKRIYEWLERKAIDEDGLLGKKRWWAKVDEKLGCYMVRTEHFHYASLAQDGLHSGSGVTEGACKFMIASRAKRSGQRWTKSGISAVLGVRSLLATERLKAFWALFAARYQTHCANAA